MVGIFHKKGPGGTGSSWSMEETSWVDLPKGGVVMWMVYEWHGICVTLGWRWKIYRTNYLTNLSIVCVLENFTTKSKSMWAIKMFQVRSTGHVVDKRCLIMDPNGARARVDSHGGVTYPKFYGFSNLDVIRIEQFSQFSIFFQHFSIMDSTFLEMAWSWLVQN